MGLVPDGSRLASYLAVLVLGGAFDIAHHALLARAHHPIITECEHGAFFIFAQVVNVRNAVVVRQMLSIEGPPQVTDFKPCENSFALSLWQPCYSK